MISFDELIQKYNGKGVDWDGSFGYQCMDLAHAYAVECVGKDIPAVPGAKDEWTKTIDGYDKIDNTPDGVPQKGDILIWGTEVGAYGHIAIFVSGDATSFTSFDQNWPVGSLCHLQLHSYKGVLGWFHPKAVVETVAVPKADFERLVTKATEYDKFMSAGFGTIEVATNQIKSLSGALSEAQEATKKVQGQLDQADEEIIRLNKELVTCQSSSQDTGPALKSAIRPLVNSGWYAYLRSRGAIQGLVNV